MSTSKKYLITSALPYANGALHFGHLSGAYLPADIVTRHHRLMNHQVMHISGSDEHGVAITLNAQKTKTPYQEYVDSWHHEHRELFKLYGIDFDFFGQTSKPYHAEEVVIWFKELYEKGLITPQADDMLQCQDCHNYLPDRYVEGTCYECKYPQARGDECPNCGIWIEPTKLIDPVCKICTSKNIHIASVTQYYLRLSKFHEEFRPWFESKKDLWRKTVWPYVDSMTHESLHDRAITRDLDWGIDVPLPDVKNKKLYVWFDAPIGYVSNTKEFLRQSGSSEHYLKDWWQNKDTEIINFIGKDNIIFHAIIFPMMCLSSGRALPVTHLPANQYVNLEGKQFSKSQGHTVDSTKALQRFGQTALRYYLITLIPENSDSSFSWEQFVLKVNGELANNIGNLASRSLKFLAKNWPEGFPLEEMITSFEKTPLWKNIYRLGEEQREHLQQFEIRKALEKVMQMGQELNLAFTEAAPWSQIKTDATLAATTIAHTALGLSFLAANLAPFLPELADQLFAVTRLGDMKKWYQGDMRDTLKHTDRLMAFQDLAPLVPKITLDMTTDL
jgi:methionyl-tRNA synthetase